MGDLDCGKPKKGAACLNMMKKGAGPLREVFFEKAKKTGSLETQGIYIYNYIYEWRTTLFTSRNGHGQSG